MAKARPGPKARKANKVKKVKKEPKAKPAQPTDRTGLYQVTFNRDVTKCAYIVSLGNANGPLGVHGSADATGGKTVEEAESVSVETTNDKGERTAEPFHLAVFC